MCFEFSTPKLTPEQSNPGRPQQTHETQTFNPTQTTDEIKQHRKQRRKMIIPKVIGKLKMQTSKQINLHNRTSGSTYWQPNYDHVIRDEKSYIRIKQYIIDNPAKWKDDQFYSR